MNAAHCISDQNKWLGAKRLQRSLVDARKASYRTLAVQDGIIDAYRTLRYCLGVKGEWYQCQVC